MTATLSLSGWGRQTPPWLCGGVVPTVSTTGSGILKPGNYTWQGGLQMPLLVASLRARRVHCALWPGTPAGITSRCSFTGNWNADATRTWRQASFRL
jgi:hypothetical protein